ncbi:MULTISPECIES: hypothetical protein [Streptomyces]|uniref:hypothetical protein n=1 Tax=Streptomyces TaxID=1883 RepID=UPI0024A5CD73|nr:MULTISPECIES: hypothetical protein [Streptomyces]GLW02573.1 hypothetical protein Slala05_62030 [Streptomyces lavendulae subsp. lavendulae]
MRAVQRRRLLLLHRLTAVPLVGPVADRLAKAYLRYAVRQMLSRARLCEDRIGSERSAHGSAPPRDSS